MNRSRTTTVVVSLAVALAMGGCGDDDPDAGSTSADEPSASYDITVGEFIAATDKKEVLQDYAANEPDNCSEVDDDFVLTASAAATNLSTDAPLEDVIVDICGEPNSS